MQKLTCPTCNEIIKAENINVQDLVAVCPNCDAIFQFKLPDEKAKRRKVKKPQNLILNDNPYLEMLFRTNFRLDANQAFLGSMISGVMMLFFSFAVGAEYIQGEVPFIVPLIFMVLALVFLYRAGLVAYNHTNITMKDDTLEVSRAPLPSVFNQEQSISLYGVTDIKCEETAISKKEHYDTPRYRVWAETADGSQRLIVNDVTEEYAYFISQQLDERLKMDSAQDISRLEDIDSDMGYEVQDYDYNDVSFIENK
ncbi:MAG: hypothetical protein Phog2KO_05170 [Phototrophicaceae bacterium]